MQPYQVFTDTVLAELARGRPTTEDALRRVSGVGEFRPQAYGHAFLNAIVAHCRSTGLTTDVPLPNYATRTGAHEDDAAEGTRVWPCSATAMRSRPS